MILDGSNGISGLPVPLPLNQGGTGQTLTASGVVKQGGGVGQLGNQIYIGWTGSLLKATVDVTDLGAIALQNTTIGYGQTWKSFVIGTATGQRQFGVTYTNSTGRPMQVAVGGGALGGSEATLLVSINGGAASIFASAAAQGIIPNTTSGTFWVNDKQSYNVSLSGTGMAIRFWTEYS